MSLHKEISFEDEVCEYLGSNGWLYEPKAAERYDRARALFTPDLIAWVQATQPQALETLTKNHGTDTQNLLLERIRKQLDTQGILDVLRYGVETYGLRQPISLAQFKPAFGMNTDLTAKYDANRLRVVRQVHYSKSNENSIDLVLFLF